MRKFGFFALLTALLSSVFFFSCSELLEARQGTLTINLPYQCSRSIYSADDVTHYEMQIFSATTDALVQKKVYPSSSKTIQSDPLSDGSYTVVLIALKDGTAIAKGSTEEPAEIKDGKSNPVTILLEMLDVDDVVDPVEPTDPNPTEPTDPVEPAEPTEPVDPVTPTDPVEPTDPAANIFYVKGESTTAGDGSSSSPFTTLSQALTRINSDDSIAEATIYVKSCDFSADGEQKYFTISKNITIKANSTETAITLTDASNSFWISSTGVLNIDAKDKALTFKSGGNTDEKVSLTTALFTVDGGELNMSDKVKLSEIYSSNSLIYVQKSGIFTLSGSNIMNNICKNVLDVNNATANLKTGFISSNTCNSTTGANGTIMAEGSAVINIGQTDDSNTTLRISSNKSQTAGVILTVNGNMTSPTINVFSNVTMQKNICTEDSNDSAGGIYMSNGSTVNVTGTRIVINDNWRKEENGVAVNLFRPENGTAVLYVEGVETTKIPSQISQ